MTEIVGNISSFLTGTPAQYGPMPGPNPVPPSGTPGLIGSGGTVDWKNLLSVGSTLASASLSLFGAGQQANTIQADGATQALALENQSRDALLQAKQEELKGQQQANDILDNLVQTQASQRLAFAGNGVDPTIGTPVSVRNATQAIADRQYSATRSDAQLQVLTRRSQALQLQQQRLSVLAQTSQKAGQARMAGVASATGSIGNLVDRRLQRG